MPSIEDDNNARRLDLIDRTRSLLARLEQGCTNHGCNMKAPKPGMHTNGPCNCWKYMADDYLQCAEIIESMPRDKRCWNRSPND